MIWIFLLLSVKAPQEITSFWAFDWGFFKSYYSVPAKLADIDTTNGHCYIYVAKDTMTFSGIDYTGSRMYAVGGKNTIFYSDDNGISWSEDKGDTMFSGTQINQLLIRAGVGYKRIMLATNSGFYLRSGTSWKIDNTGVMDTLSNKDISYITTCPDKDTNTFYIYASIGNKVFYRLSQGVQQLSDWTLVPNIPDSIGYIYKLMGIPGDSGAYAVSKTGIYYFDKGTSLWTLENSTPLAGDTTIIPLALKHARNSDTKFYLLTNKGLWESINSGGSWTEILADTTLNEIYPLGGDTIYVLGKNGLLFSPDGANFVSKNTGLLDEGIPPYATDIRSMYVLNDTTMFLGTVEGMFRWSGNKWVMANNGIFHSQISDADIQRIYDIFEHTTPAHPDSGVWDIVTGFLGEPATDVDSIPKIVIFLLDMKEAYSQAGMHLEHMAGYFDPVNEHTQYYVEHYIDKDYKTNLTDMLYLNIGDTNALNIQDTVEVAKTLAHNLARMIYYKKDPDEWGSRKVMNDGCPQSVNVEAASMFSEYLVYRGEGNPDTMVVDTTTNDTTKIRYTYPKGNNLFRFGDAYLGDNTMNAETEDLTAYLWAMYLYEHYGISIFKDIMDDTIGVGIQSIDDALSKIDTTLNTRAVFNNFIVAVAVDDTTIGDGKYGFKYINTKIGPSPFMPGVGASQYPVMFENTPPWSWDGIMITLSLPVHAKPDTLRFNGTDAAILKPFVLKWKNDTTFYRVDSILIDSLDRGDYYIGDFYDGAKYDSIYILNVNEDTMDATGLISEDRTPPSFVKLGIFQNPFAHKYLDIYGYASELLYRDVDNEYPIILMDTIPLDVSVFDAPNTDSIVDVYYAEATINDTGIITITMKGQDISGNDIIPVQKQVSVAKKKSGEILLLSSPDKKLSLNIGEDGVASGTYIVISDVSDVPSVKNPTKRQIISDIYAVSSASIPIKGRVNLSFSISKTSNDLGIYRWNGTGWDYIGGKISKGNITAKINKFGIYSVQKGPHPLLPQCTTVYLSINKNVGNHFIVSFGVPEKGDISIHLYDIMGRSVKTVIEGSVEPGVHNLNLNLERVSAGIYFLRMKTEKKLLTKKIILLK